MRKRKHFQELLNGGPHKGYIRKKKTRDPYFNGGEGGGKDVRRGMGLRAFFSAQSRKDSSREMGLLETGKSWGERRGIVRPLMHKQKVRKKRETHLSLKKRRGDVPRSSWCWERKDAPDVESHLSATTNKRVSSGRKQSSTLRKCALSSQRVIDSQPLNAESQE